MPGAIAIRYYAGVESIEPESLAADRPMFHLSRLTLVAVIAVSAILASGAAEAARRGTWAHHSQVKVWHGNRVGSWSHGGHWPGHVTHAPGWAGHSPVWRPRWSWHWSRTNGYPHRWWSWHQRRHARFAARRGARHAMRGWGHGLPSSHWSNPPRRPGVWYASPGFGSTAARGPVRQGEWHAQ
jgi:hypothetical protein